jgi:predicted tellurium resistance membrane protein TerC
VSRMPEHSKLIERVIVGMVACAVSVDVLATELPRVMPYLVVVVVLFVAVRLVLYHTQKW